MIRKGYAATPQGDIHFRSVRGPGEPLVLLHRTPVSSQSFEPVLHALAGRRSAYALDTPGFGQSFVPPSSPTTSDYAKWFLDALDALAMQRFHLCAHHTGTHFAAEMAAAAPQRVISLTLSGVLYEHAAERARIRKQIGYAARPDACGQYLQGTWTLIRSLMPGADLQLAHRETLGALQSLDGRDQAFNAILSQNFAAVLARVSCPVQIIQACDDPLAPMLGRVAMAHPAIAIEILGPAGLAAPELQATAFSNRLLAFADQHDPSGKEHLMTDRRYELIRTATGYDLARTAAVRPTPGPGEILLRVHAVSINKRDLMIRELTYPAGDANHFTPLSDAAGEVVAVGAGVLDVQVGDKVCSTFFQNWPQGKLSFPALTSALGAGGRGVFADYVVLAAGGVAPMPAGWSYEAAATLPCAGVTAWNALVTRGQLQRGEWVLVIGTGGVALFALQIAVAAGANVAVISSSNEKLERARQLGASVTVNYATRPDWDSAIRDATGGGVQHVVELGGTGTMAKSIASLALEGHVAMIGALAGFGGDIPGVALIMGTHRVGAVTCGPRSDQIALSNFLVQHGIQPVIDQVFEFDQAGEAYARANAGAFGKVVVRLS